MSKTIIGSSFSLLSVKAVVSIIFNPFFIVSSKEILSNFIAPLKVKVKVEKINPRLEVVYFNDFFLKKIGDEITAVRFILDDKGNVLDLNQLQKPIISGKVK